MTYQLMTPLSPDEYKRLRDDIRENGVVVPVVVDEEGNLLDGYHRRRAAAELRAEGVDVYEPEPDVRTGLTEAEKLLLSVHLNLNRRQLTDYQRLQIARRLEEAIRQVTHERQVVNLRRGDAPPRSGQMTQTGPTADRVEPGTRARDAVAEIAGIGDGKTYERRRQIVEELEDLSRQGVEDATQALERAEQGEVDMGYLRRTRERLHRSLSEGVSGVFTEDPAEPETQAPSPPQTQAERWCHMVLTQDEFHSIRPHALRRREWRVFDTALVTLTLPEAVVREMARDLPDRLRGPAVAALDPDAAKEIEGLSSPERGIIDRVRRKARKAGTFEIVVQVADGQVSVKAEKTWHWYEKDGAAGA